MIFAVVGVLCGVAENHSLHIHRIHNIPDQIPIRCIPSPNDISVHYILSNFGDRLKAVRCKSPVGFACAVGALSSLC